MNKIMLFCLAGIFLLPNFLWVDIHEHPPFDRFESFNDSLSTLQTVDDLTAYTDSLAAAQHINPHSIHYVSVIEKVLKSRFYHGFSHFTLNENWLAAVSGKLFEEGLACKVNPADIVHQSNAACSQQSLVMMAILRKKGFPYRHVGFPHHYALEVLHNNEWYFFDPDMEPTLQMEERRLSNWKHQSDALKPFYDTLRFKDLDFKFGIQQMATTGTINEIPAQHAHLFQTVTHYVSRMAWCIPLLLAFYRTRRQFPFLTKK
ncbi:MAG: hypothetical protein ACOYKE_02700 [Ferruginibacter sp.]